jgi:two-component system, OmpR family, response regulator VicR
MNGRILLVDDEKGTTNLLEEVLRREGFQSIRIASDGQKAIDVCREFMPHVIVLDIMLPDLDGFEVCRQIRQFSQSPILFLSSRSDEVDKILGLASGGDDYHKALQPPRNRLPYQGAASQNGIQSTESGRDN